MSSILPEEFGDYSDEELVRAVVEEDGWDSEDPTEVPDASDSMAGLPAPIHLEFRSRFAPAIRDAARSVGYNEEEALTTVLLALLYGPRAVGRIDATGMFEGEFLGLAKRVNEGRRKPSNLDEGELEKLAEGAGGRSVRDRIEEMLNELGSDSQQPGGSPRFIDYMPKKSLTGISSPTDKLRDFLSALLEGEWTRKDEIEEEVEKLTSRGEYSRPHENLLSQARKAKRAAEAVSFASTESDLFEKYDRSQEGNVGGWLSEVAKRLFRHFREKRSNKAEPRSFRKPEQSSQQQGRGRKVPDPNASNAPFNESSDDLDEDHISRGVPEILEFAETQYGLDLSSGLGISGELTEKPIKTKIELIGWLSREHEAEWFRSTHYYAAPFCYQEALEEVELPTLRYQLLGADLPADLDHAGDLDPPANTVRTFHMDLWHDQVCSEIQGNGGEQTPNRATIGNWVKRGRDDFKEAIKEEWPDPHAGALIEVFHVDSGGDNPD